MSFADFEEYKKQGEPDKQKKAENWGIAIGLQQVDGLTPSKYLLELAVENIEGKIDSQEVKKRIDSYYKTDEGKVHGSGKEEADKVSAHITELLSEVAFTFSPTTLVSIHKKLFFDVFPQLAGKIRDYNITKNEMVLNGDTVMYGSSIDIKETLDYDFDKEKNFEYKGLNEQQKVEHIADFISGVWQIHPFGEGNTRTIAVFTIKYLRAMGFDANNEFFENNAKYFRDALVRANYQNIKNDISYTKKYLYDFFDNLLLGGNKPLDSKNLIINVGVKALNVGVNVGVKAPDVGVNEVVLGLLVKNPHLTVKELANKVGKTERTIERAMSVLKKENKIVRIGSDKTGYWQVISHGSVV